MRYMQLKFITAVFILIVGIVLTSLPRVTAQRQPLSAEEQKLLDVAAKREGLDATRLKVLKSTTVELPLTGRHVQTAKVLNPENGQTFTASIDEQGQDVDFSTLKAAEQRAYHARYGKLDPKLYKKIEDGEQNINDPQIQKTADQKIKVAFWLNPAEDLEAQDPRDGHTDLTREEVDALIARLMDQVKADTDRATEGLTRALERAGHV